VPDPFSQETRGFGEWGGILARSESLSRLAAARGPNFRQLRVPARRMRKNQQGRHSAGPAGVVRSSRITCSSSSRSSWRPSWRQPSSSWPWSGSLCVTR